MHRLAFLFLLTAALPAADWKAGLARIDITPEGPIWLSGYAARTHPSDGVRQKIWAKALALEDNQRGRVVIVTVDLIAVTRWITDSVAARMEKDYRLERPRLLINASHTHTGPMIWRNLEVMADLPPEQLDVLKDYSQRLVDKLVSVAGAAMGDLAPARVAIGHGKASFAVNRREPTPQGFRIGVNAAGPVDNDVPVLLIAKADGQLRAVLFGYACHNTTLGANIYEITGDYAGFAQEEFERTHPGVTAMFLMLAGADQNPNPRGTLELVEKHGKSLAAEAGRVIDGRLEELRGPVRAAFRNADLTFAAQEREKFEKDLSDKNPFKVRRAKAMLRVMDEDRPVRRVAYPVQAFRFGKQLTLVALGGELVVDYALRIKREYPGEHIVVAGYSNYVPCYIPSVRVLKEGGYEADDSMIYYGQPGPFDETVEEKVMAGVYDVLKRVGRQRKP